MHAAASAFMRVPDDIDELELSPQPAVPPTAMVPASATDIVTSGEVSEVGVLTALDSVAAATEVSTVNAVNVSALAWFPAVSVNVIVHVYALLPLVLSVTVFEPEQH